MRVSDAPIVVGAKEDVEDEVTKEVVVRETSVTKEVVVKETSVTEEVAVKETSVSGAEAMPCEEIKDESK